jgi:HEAT repeat protein
VSVATPPAPKRRPRSRASQFQGDSALELTPQLKIRKVILAIITGVLPDDLRSEALRLLIETLRTSDEDIRSLAVIGLHEVGVGSPVALDAFVDVLNDPSPAVRRRAARAIGDFGPNAEHVVRELITLMNDDETCVQIEAINALGKLGTAAKPAIPALVSLLGDDDCRMRTIAGMTLRKIGRMAVPHVIGALSDPNAVARERAAHLLGKFGFTTDIMVEALLESTADCDYDVRDSARQSLETLQTPLAG